MDKIKEFGDSVFTFVMDNFHNPMFWIFILIVMLIIMFTAIKDLGNK